MAILFRDVIERAIQVLSEEGIGDAVTDAWLLSEYCLGINKQKYYMDMNIQIEDADCEKYMKYVEKRKSHIPLQHITGEQEFMGLTFHVNEHVLIPRQDTELLVEKAIKAVEKVKRARGINDEIKVLDMCTGSGCIAISVAKLCENTKVTAVDISEEALEVAKKNACNNSVEIEFIQSDLFENVGGKYDVILSNPPYIPTKIIDTLEEEVKSHEPLRALDGDEDGLSFYRKISEEAFRYLKEDGYLIYEVGHDQGDMVSLLLRKKASYVRVYKDLAENDRVVIAGKEEENV